MIMGVGLGNPATEYSKFGEDSKERIRAEKLDESLDIITGLWSGKKFSYHGKHYQLENVIFKPRPVQKPGIPILVGGFWPNKPPFRRAARYDGVYPSMNWPDVLTTKYLRRLLDYIKKHRKKMGHFDVIIGGSTPGDSQKGAEVVDPWIKAGATWWSEDINGWRGSLEDMRKRISQGPPRV
jgi:alkanesulfonate monooxygenase SsuD/methylene tetrahydromethanopterin reductase-like flavin-dependent oxidoreductase (luciferase family)